MEAIELKPIFHLSFSSMMDLEPLIDPEQFEYQRFASIEECLAKIEERHCNLLIIELSEMTVEHLTLLAQFGGRCIFIFENSIELEQSLELTSKFNSFSLFKDVNLVERLTNLFVQLGMGEGNSEYLELNNLSINTEAKIFLHADELTTRTIRIRKPGVSSCGVFQSLQFYLKYFGFLERFEASQTTLDSGELVFESDFSEIYQRISVLNMKNNPKVVCAYITDEPINYELFYELGVKVNLYKDLKDFKGEEDFIIIRDKLIYGNESTGTKLAEMGLSDKCVLVTNRRLPMKKYKMTSFRSTTENINALVLKNFFLENRIDQEGEIFTFDARSNITFGELRISAEISFMSESILKVNLPFELEPGSKVQLGFFEHGTFTSLDVEPDGGSFLHTLNVDCFNEVRMNDYRAQLYKMFYCQDNSISLSHLTAISDLVTTIIEE